MLRRGDPSLKTEKRPLPAGHGTADSLAGYGTWQAHAVTVRGRSITLCSKPGIPEHHGADASAALLAENLDLERTETVLSLNCGAGLVGVVAAHLAPEGRVILADSNVVAVEAARRTLDANGVPNAEVHLSAGTSHLALTSPVDVALVRLPKGRLPTLQLIWDAFQSLRLGSRLLIAGANDEGIQSALGRVEALFGDVAVLEYRKGSRVAMAVKRRGLTPYPSPSEMERGGEQVAESETEEATAPGTEIAGEFANRLLDHRTFHRFTCELRGRAFVVCSRPGVFSWERLDPGSRALIETMEVQAGERVLDLGCGTGIVGVVAASLARRGEVYLVDADVDAVDSARETVSANGLSTCVVLPGDSISAVRDVRFDVVVTNPPFHLGKAADFDVAGQFIEDAARVLRAPGRFYLVANRFLAYEERLRRVFAHVDTVFADKQYRVFLASEPGGEQPKERTGKRAKGRQVEGTTRRLDDRARSGGTQTQAAGLNRRVAPPAGRVSRPRGRRR